MLNYQNRICEELLLIFFSIMIKKWLLLKYIPISRLESKNDTLFMTKNGRNLLKLIPYLWPKHQKNHTLWGRTYLYSPYKEVPPPPRATELTLQSKTSEMSQAWSHVFLNLCQRLKWHLVTGRLLAQHLNSGMHYHSKLETPSRWIFLNRS